MHLRLLAHLLLALCLVTLLLACATTPRADDAPENQTQAPPPQDLGPAASPQDLAAIKSMTGRYNVSYQFEETQALRVEGEPAPPYTAQAVTRVSVIKESPRRVELQHLLLIDEAGLTLKHSRQRWELTPKSRLRYLGGRDWQKQREPEPAGDENENALWVRTVFNADDSPIYSTVGRWRHDEDASIWESGPTIKPLPRRELSRRGEYDRLSLREVIRVTPDGWNRSQEAVKLRGPAASGIALEKGLVSYQPLAVAAPSTGEVDPVDADWQSVAGFWSLVRQAWDERIDTGRGVRIASDVDGQPLWRGMFDLAERYRLDPDAQDWSAMIDELLTAYVTLR